MCMQLILTEKSYGKDWHMQSLRSKVIKLLSQQYLLSRHYEACKLLASRSEFLLASSAQPRHLFFSTREVM